jgi:hypothetical protein
MYSSLGKIDIVVQDKNGPGKIFVQTDHRSAEEFGSELEVSVLFALTRTIVPRRVKDAGGAIVRHVCMETVHPALVEVAAATGAQVESAGVAVSLEGARRRAPADIADEAFASLGKRLLGGATADAAALATFESRVTKARADAEDEDEIGNWTAVAELAAVTGEVLRAKYGGRWVDDPRDFADIPFMFQPTGDKGLVNPVGKAIKFLAHGDAESPRQLLQLVDDAGAPEGPLLFSLKPSHWGARGEAVCEPFAPDMEKAGADIPLVVYGRDQPNTFALFMKDGAREKDMGALRRQALGNLAKVDVQVQRVALEPLTFWVIQGSYFATEKILDQAFLNTLHTRLEAQLLAAAVPTKGQLLVTSAIAGPEKIMAFMAIAKGIYEKNEGGRQLSPTVFLVSEGKVTGVATVRSEGDEPKKEEKKGFFKRLFS